MMSFWDPFAYDYMRNAIWVSAMVGALCGLLSAYLMLKGWSLVGDAMSHAIVPGVAGAYMLGLPFGIGAFLAAGLAAAGMLILKQVSKLHEDAVIGVVFIGFFGLGLFMISISPIPVPVNTIILGNILAIAPQDVLQLALIGFGGIGVIALKWRDFMLLFFDEAQARALGLPVLRLRVVFFAILAASCVAAMQTVGAFLVVAMIVTPGATAYLLTDRFGVLLLLSGAIGGGSAAFGAYVSYFWDAATGGVIVVVQTALFVVAYVLAPKHSVFAANQQRQK